MSTFWHGMSNMSSVNGREVVIDRADGVRLWDTDGKEYLDGTAALWYCNVGHGRPEIIDAITRQLGQLDTFHTFDVYSNPAAEQLSDKLSSLAPMSGTKVFLTPGGGSDSVDTAAKLVRRYWNLKGKPKKKTIVSRHHGYHGMNGFGTSIAGIPANVDGYGTLMPDVCVVDTHSVDAVARLFEESGDHIAAFFGEPVIGAGGVRPPAEEYWPTIAALCRKHDVLLVSDDVVCAFGRLGYWFGCEFYGFTPDLITCAKGLTSGYLPLGAVLASGEFASVFWDDPGAPLLRHGYTYSGNPPACAAAIANLAIIENDGILDKVRREAPIFADLVTKTFAEHPLVSDVRCAGFMATVEIDANSYQRNPDLAVQVAANARERGLITRAMGNALQISPPLITDSTDLESMIDRLVSACDEMAIDQAKLSTRQ